MREDDNAHADEYLNARRRMAERQLVARGITDERVLSAIVAVPRHEFMPPERRADAHFDGAVPIGEGQTISQPYMVALMVELLEVEPGQRILEVGAGSGYQAAVLAEMGADVYGIELIPALAKRAEAVLERLGYEQAHIITGDGSKGYAKAAPYDGIIVAAAAPAISPAWVEQLREGGRIVAPVGSRHYQVCTVARKVKGEMKVREDIGCVFVPLLGEHGWDREL